MCTWDLYLVPPAAVRHGRARQSSGTLWDWRRVLWVSGPRGQYTGIIRLIEKPGVRGDRHVAERKSDPRVAYPEVKVQVRDLVRVVGIVAPFATRGVGNGENSFDWAQGGKWAPSVSAAPAAVRLGAKFKDGNVGDCRRVLWVLGPRDQYSGKIRFIEKPGVQDEGSPWG